MLRVFLDSRSKLHLSWLNWPMVGWWFLVCVAWIVRIYLVLQLPIWSDEMYSIWTAHQSWWRILTGLADPVHPPGYYVLLKLWLWPTDQLQWARALSLVASGLNVGLIWLISKQEVQLHRHAPPALGWWWSLAYALSGYHLLFDWQARMYSLVVTWILATWLVWRRPASGWMSWSLGGLALTGLWLDYAYLWFYIPLFLATTVQLWIARHQAHLLLVASRWVGLLLAGFGFGTWLLVTQTWSETSLVPIGIDGIKWMGAYFTPVFFGPYFLGSFWVWPLTCFILVTWGWLAWQDRHWLWQWPILKTVIFSVIAMVDAILVFSVLKQPLFHVRSLQIVGLLCSLMWGIWLSRWPRWRWWLISLLAATIPVLLIGLYVRFDQILVNFYPWHRVRADLETTTTGTLYLTPLPTSPSPLLEYGLEFVLKGKERLGQKPLPFVVVPIETPLDGECQTHFSYLSLIRSCQ